MAGAVGIGGNRGGRRALDTEINMIPMIDLLMVTISFLLLTAVWVHMKSVNANAQVPGADAPPCEGAECVPPRILHVEMRDAQRFTLWWSEGGREIARTDIPRKDVVEKVGTAKAVHYPGLEDEIAKEWNQWGTHRAATDRQLDRAVLVADDAASYAQLIGAIDALHGVQRPIVSDAKKGAAATAPTGVFNVTFSAK